MNDIKLLCPPKALLLLAAPPKSPYWGTFAFYLTSSVRFVMILLPYFSSFRLKDGGVRVCGWYYKQ